MKKVVFTGLLFVMALAVQAQNDQDIVKTGDTMPAFSIVSDNGKEVKSSTLEGKVVLVNFFATWCQPCQKKLAAVKETLWPKYQDNKDFVMLTIGREHSDKELAEYNQKKGFVFPLSPDKNRAIYASFAKSLIPRSYLIGKDGKIIHATVGYKEEDMPELMALIDQALK
jgi:peroxiredoxin